MGERGMTLSGGQRQRLALARALYSGAELYLLDDIFSGLDGATAAHVARHAIYGLMREKGATVVLVTHAIDLLYGADVVVGMGGGRIRSQARIVVTGEQRRQVEAEGQREEEEQGGKVEGPKSEEPPLGEEEGREEGGVKLDVYAQYVRCMGRGVSAALLLVMLGMQLSANAFNFWLGRWAHDVGRYSDQDFLTISATIAGINSLMTLLRSFLFAYAGLRAAKVLHDQLLGAMLHTAIAFFDATPLGTSHLPAVSLILLVLSLGDRSAPDQGPSAYHLHGWQAGSSIALRRTRTRSTTSCPSCSTSSSHRWEGLSEYHHMAYLNIFIVVSA